MEALEAMLGSFYDEDALFVSRGNFFEKETEASDNEQDKKRCKQEEESKDGTEDLSIKQEKTQDDGIYTH
jgi:hypothetical protein